MVFVAGIPVRVVGLFILVDGQQRQQKEPRRKAEWCGERGNAEW